VADVTLPIPQISPATIDTWRTDAPITVIAAGYRITIPEGTLSDGASIPRICWPIVSPFEVSVIAPFVHDLLYQRLGKIDDFTTVGRNVVDRIFYDLMKQENVWWWRRWLAFRAVRIFGGSHWKAA
jgi:hypothetical protein